MTRKLKFNKVCAIFALCVAAMCPATTCSFDASLPSMDIRYGLLTPVFPIAVVEIDCGDPAGVGDENAGE